MHAEFEAVCGPKFMTFWDDVGDSLWLSTISDMRFQITLTSEHVPNFR